MESVVNALKEFIGITHNREPEGYLSWQHLVFVTAFILVAVVLAIVLGKKMRNRPEKDKIRVLKVTAVVMVAVELLKIILYTVLRKDWLTFLDYLPLFLCSIILITLPIAAFSHGRLQEGGMDFVFIFGCLCMIAGTYLAANIFGPNPVIQFFTCNSVTTHCISGFASLYIAIAGLCKMKKKNIWITLAILVGFELVALIADLLLKDTKWQHNYMFFLDTAGTPFAILETFAGGIKPLYTFFVMLIYIVYLFAFIGVYQLITKGKKKKED